MTDKEDFINKFPFLVDKLISIIHRKFLILNFNIDISFIKLNLFSSPWFIINDNINYLKIKSNLSFYKCIIYCFFEKTNINTILVNKCNIFDMSFNNCLIGTVHLKKSIIYKMPSDQFNTDTNIIKLDNYVIPIGNLLSMNSNTSNIPIHLSSFFNYIDCDNY